MEFNKLQIFVVMLVLIGMIIGVGVLTFEKIGSTSTSKIENVLNESVTWSALNINFTLAKENATSIIRVVNTTGGESDPSNYVLLAGGAVNATGNESTCRTSDTCFVDYKFTNYNTETSRVFKNTATAVASISTTWMGLIVTMVILVILMALIISSFGNLRNR